MAYQVLRDWHEGRGFVEDLLAAKWNDDRPKNEDLRLSQEIVYGIFRNLRLIDFWIDRTARKGISSLPEEIVDCLRIGLYQIGFLDRIPVHAAVNESVGLCRAVGFEPMKGLVNGLLRQFPTRRRDLDRTLSRDENNLAISTSHPDWLVSWATNRWGLKKAEAWLAANNRSPRIYLRPVTCRLLEPETGSDPAESQALAARRLIETIGFGEYFPESRSVLLPEGSSPRDLDAFRDGLAVVQDPSAQQAVRVLDPKPGEKIYDLCAAPGGKVLQIADWTNDRAEVLATDRSADRLRKVEENVRRCAFQSIETLCHDLLEPWPEEPDLADAVLLDAPCSGLGTLRRRVDLRYRIDPDQIRELAARSRCLLEAAAALVKPGGRLVYSTCTLTEEENEETVSEFLKVHPGEWSLEEQFVFPDWLGKVNEEIPDRIPEHDGAFVALLARRK
jgi:16S rRNA (cytosine967-C5)-methyltransferase